MEQVHEREADASATQADSRRWAFEVAICDLKFSFRTSIKRR